MTATLIGYARCSTDKQDLAAQRAALEKLGVEPKKSSVKWTATSRMCSGQP